MKLTDEERQIIAADILEHLRPDLVRARMAILQEVLARLPQTYPSRVVPSHLNQGTVVYDEVPLGVTVPIDGHISFPVFPESGFFAITGVRSFNDPGEIEIVRMSTGAADIPLNAAPFDSASYSLPRPVAADGGQVLNERSYHIVEWGMISRECPMSIVAQPENRAEKPCLRWTLYGVWVQPYGVPCGGMGPLTLPAALPSLPSPPAVPSPSGNCIPVPGSVAHCSCWWEHQTCCFCKVRYPGDKSPNDLASEAACKGTPATVDPKYWYCRNRVSP